MKTGNAGPKLHWNLREKRGFPALPHERYVLAYNRSHDGLVWGSRQLFLAYCLLIGAILKKTQLNFRFAPIDSSNEVGPALPIAIRQENGHAMRELTEISRPAWSVYCVGVSYRNMCDA